MDPDATADSKKAGRGEVDVSCMRETSRQHVPESPHTIETYENQPAKDCWRGINGDNITARAYLAKLHRMGDHLNDCEQNTRGHRRSQDMNDRERQKEMER
jgi:hypothetical protein